eukprot:scaffold17997_cov42-Phaeocystis_antarctica.AAC.2
MSVRTAGGKALSRAPEGDRTGTPAGVLSTAGPGASPSQCYATAAGAAAVPCRRARLLGLGLGLRLGLGLGSGRCPLQQSWSELVRERLGGV